MSILKDVEAAAEWMARALLSSGYQAEFSVASLWEVERFFVEHSVRGEARPGGMLTEQLGERLFGLGSYVGEVIRRSAGGTWAAEDDDPDIEINVRLELTDGTTIWPVQRAMKRLWNGTQDSLVEYGTDLGLDLRSGPPANSN